MPSKLTPAVTLLSLIAAIHGSAQAALFAVDQGPYSPQNGNFAQWYQDTHGRTLDLCLGKALSSRVPSTPGVPSYMCTLAVAAGVFDDNQPTVFPTNFPDEAFWFLADAAIPTAGATALNLKYTAALEAAFGGGDPAPNDQISFARIRIRMDAPVAGTYTITHPYGVDVFQVDTPGTKAINMTRDIGIGSPGNYSGALTGDVGPFLRSVNGPYIETDPTTGIASSYVGDPNLTEQVTGSPFNTNFIHVEGPNGIDGRTDVFGITGKLSTVVRPTPTIVQRATYSRKTGGTGNSGVQAQEDVFSLAPPPPGTSKFVDTDNADIAMTEADGTGSWYGQSTANPTLPVNLQVTADNHVAIPQNTPTTVPHALTDLVSIDTANYSLSSGQLTLVASTSDAATATSLTATGSSGGAIGTLSGDGAIKTLTTGISPIPPAKVTVTSANGGSDTEEVVIVP
ncbi:hypothetical protein [Pseudomonas abietaniphila]|uniref:Uncharacterized protein n=1 Tax=Pseudomonas abietaniphila TaxID=89065 RepID=A0A1G7T4L0_9PSED|nr:hypothetical protein [Pseudomonas abietaniphila]SDG30236.1 hypothetical protein SAMN05216605_101667 [Pseudomonas abietaniphila]